MELQDLDFFDEIDKVMENFEATRYNERNQGLEAFLSGTEAFNKNEHKTVSMLTDRIGKLE